MKVLNQYWELNSFFRALSKTKQRLLMLDYDGTIAPFKVNRMEAFPYPEVSTLLEKLIKTQITRVVIVTGRQISDLFQIFNLSKTLEIWGSHGLERLTPDGKYQVTELDQVQLDGLEKAKELFDKLGLTKQSEMKVGCIALHWRGLDLQDIESIYENTVSSLRSISNKYRLGFYSFNGGLELRSPKRNKGFAVKQILSDMQQNSLSAYLGDDLTDEYAFKAIKNKGLAILVSSEQKFTDADICLETPLEVVDFFQRWVDTESR